VTSHPESRGGAHKTYADAHSGRLVRQVVAGVTPLGEGGRRQYTRGEQVAYLVDVREVSQELDDLRAVE
jgi:hypothetical protein